MAGSNVQRTIRQLKLEGCVCAVAEKWVPMSYRAAMKTGYRDPGKKQGNDQDENRAYGFRKDLFGFIDVISLDPSKGIVAIQACGADFSAHRRKIIEDRTQEVLSWLECGGKIEIWGWRKVKLKRGGKAVRWQPRIEPITMEDFTYADQPKSNDRHPGGTETELEGSQGQDENTGQKPVGGFGLDFYPRRDRFRYRKWRGGGNT